MENPGIYSINVARTEAKRKTCVVIGLERGGTSMVASVLHHLGVYMGSDLGATYENFFFAKSSLQYYNSQNKVYLKQIDDEIKRLNGMRDLWGWKFPSIVMEDVYERLRNPHLFFVFRDHIAIAKRMEVSGKLSFEQALAYILRFQEMINDYVAKTTFPSLLISYEKSLLHPGSLVERIAEFLAISCPQEDKLAAARNIAPSPDSYLQFSRSAKIQGHLDVIGPKILGWVRDIYEEDRRLVVQIVIDDDVHEVLADKFREDVKDAGYGDGSYGFEFSPPARFLDGKAHAFRILVPGEDDVRIGGVHVSVILTS